MFEVSNEITHKIGKISFIYLQYCCRNFVYELQYDYWRKNDMWSKEV